MILRFCKEILRRPWKRDVRLQVKTSGKAGGMNKPWKGMVRTRPLKGPRKDLPTVLLFRATPKGVLFYAFVSLLPVNGSMYSLRLI